MSTAVRYDTPARTALLAWMAADPKTRTKLAIARALGLTYQAIGHWIEGYARPDARIRELIQTLTGIPSEGWELKEERDAFAAARRRARKARATFAAPLPATGTEG